MSDGPVKGLSRKQTSLQLLQPKQGKAQQGFTLIEIMVVVVIIGVMLTAVVALRGGGQQHRYLQAEAQRITHLVTVVQQQAAQNGLPARLVFSDSGYEFEFWQLNDDESDEPVLESEKIYSVVGQWQKADQGNLRAYKPDWPMSFKLAQVSNKNTESPGLMIYPDGLLTPSEIRISLEDWQQDALLTTDGFSSLTVELVELDDD